MILEIITYFMTTKILTNNTITELTLDTSIEVAIKELLIGNPTWSMNDAILHFLKLGILESHKKRILDSVVIDDSNVNNSEMTMNLAMTYKDSPDSDADIVLDWSKVKKFV
jgi:hypothetical protein